MAGFGRVDEECRGTGGGHGGGDFRADMAVLAHSSDDDSTRGGRQDVESGAEALVEGTHKRRQAIDLELQDAARREELRMFRLLRLAPRGGLVCHHDPRRKLRHLRLLSP